MKRWRKRRSWSLSRGARSLPMLRSTAPVSLLCAAMLLATSSPVLAAEPSPIGSPIRPRGILLVSLPQVSWNQLRSGMPKTDALMSGTYAFPAIFSVALMPIASPADADQNRTWVTLGAGRAAAGATVTGTVLPGGGFRVDVAPLKAANDRAHTGAVPGLFGSELHARGLTTALVAYNAASGRSRLPPSAATVMDQDGRIDGGGIYEPAELTPFGKRLDPAQVESAITAEFRRHRKIVLLDLTGVGPLTHVDSLTAGAVAAARRHGVLPCLVTALSPAYREKDRRAMGMVVMVLLYDWDIPVSNLLRSANTRWQGVVTAADVAPTLLAVCSHEVGMGRSAAGRIMEEVSSPYPGPLVRLDRLDRMLTDQFILEGKAARLYVVYMMALAAATAILVGRRRGLRWLAMPALVGVALPIGLLLCPLAGIGQTRQLVAACLLSVVLGGFALWPGAVGRPLGIVLLSGAALILADPPLGNPLMRFAPLGFGAITGARFYGIGNEYVGVLGAMAPLGLGLMLQETPRARWLAPIIGAVVVLVVGAPWWGANWGGCVSVAAGLLATWVALAPRRWWRRAIIGLCGVVVAAALPAALDLLQPESARSHIGAAASALIGGQLEAVREIALRKIEMNWRLAQLASWWWLLAPVALLGIWALVRRGESIWRGVSSAGLLTSAATPSPIRAGFIGAVVAALVGLIANDSGIVMLGMTMAVTFSAFVFLLARAEAAAA